MIDLEKINFNNDNLIPAVVIDSSTGQVLMLGYMNRNSLQITIQTGKVTFFSRKRERLWVKGETSGNYLLLKDIIPDCDYDTLLVYAEPAGPTCHTGGYSCFKLNKKHLNFLFTLSNIIEERKSANPDSSYTARLFEGGSDRVIQKFGEEAIETLIAAKNRSKEEIIYESADLLFHLMVMLSNNDLSISDVIRELESRHK
jgi:phosphoribosyl-AMP cyclohydrolase / phosphoribosyl-ATP pyrophosphohydrolase